MSNPSNDAVMAFLARTSLSEIRKRVREMGTEELADWLTEEWRREPEEEEAIMPDSVEAAEGAELDSQTEEDARETWEALSEETKTRLLAAAKMMGADEDLEGDLL